MYPKWCITVCCAKKHIAKHDCIDLIIVDDIRSISNKEDKVFSLEHNRNKGLTAILSDLKIAKKYNDSILAFKKEK